MQQAPTVGKRAIGVTAVRDYQRLQGLEVDGVVGVVAVRTRYQLLAR